MNSATETLKEVFEIFKAFSLRESSTRHVLTIVAGTNVGIDIEYRPGTKSLFYAIMYNPQNMERVDSAPESEFSYLTARGYTEKLSKNIANISRYSEMRMDKSIEKMMDEHIKEMDSNGLEMNI